MITIKASIRLCTQGKVEKPCPCRVAVPIEGDNIWICRSKIEECISISIGEIVFSDSRVLLPKNSSGATG